jgi:uncharacterized protein (TIGR00266 family)
MTYEIQGAPLPVVIFKLESGEALNTQRGAMSWMSPNMNMETNAGGGLGQMFSRAISGESIFQNVYTAENGPGLIACASTLPGQILAIPVSSSRTIVAQKKAFLASERGVDMNVFFQHKFGAGFFGGEGFFMEKFTGNGMVFLEIDGSVIEYDLREGQRIIVNTGNIAAMDDTVAIDVETVKGLGNMIFGGEGIFNTVLTGPGHIWLQTMSLPKMAGTLYALMPHDSNHH